MPNEIKINSDYSFLTEHYCLDCIKFSPTSDDKIVYANGKPAYIHHTISCSDYDVCRNLYEKLKKEQDR